MKISFFLLMGILLFYFTAVPGLQTGNPSSPPEARYFLEGKENKVFLTFNVLWERDNLEYILSTLKEHDIRAIFFVTGEWIKNFPYEAEEIINSGHYLGNKTLSHRRLLLLGEEETAAEISEFNQLAVEKLNYSPQFFRPPYGEYNPKIIQMAEEEGCVTLLWSINTLMLSELETEIIISRLEEKLHDGAVLLFHTSSPQIENNLEEIIEFIQWKGYNIASPRLLKQ